MAPIAIGLTFASGIALAQTTDHSIIAYGITGLATLVLAIWDVTPILLLAIGAAIAYFIGF